MYLLVSFSLSHRGMRKTRKTIIYCEDQNALDFTEKSVGFAPSLMKLMKMFTQINQ